MITVIRRSIVAILCIVTLTEMTRAETFEFLTYTPPASGWEKKMSADGPVYRRTQGVGLISLYASYPTSLSAADEFTKIWRGKIEIPISVKAPQPKIETAGEFKIAIGAQTVDAQGTVTTISVVTFVGRGRAISLSAIAAGDDVMREVSVFLDTVDLAKEAPNATSTTAGAVDVDFDVPAGYTSQRDGQTVVLKPVNLSRMTPCIYGFSPSRPSSKNLEADARGAILEPLPGWQIKSDHYNAMRGVSGGGWQYYWFRTDVQQLSGASMQYLTAMAMAFPSGPGRLSILWGFGSTGVCNADDLTFLRLFFSLRPRGVTPDGGKALGRELEGLWRDTQSSGLAQYKFLPTGQYQYGLGTSTTFGNLETRTGGVSDGRWELRGSNLILTGGSRGGKYRVRIYDELIGGVWRRAMSLLNESSTPVLDVQYMRIDR